MKMTEPETDGVNRFVIITSILPPTAAVRAYAKLPEWQVVVVGDKKTPDNWKCAGVTYLSPSDQEKLEFRLIRRLPWNHYCRKMVGYLYAISQGATVIATTDDDNIPLKTWGYYPFHGEFETLFGSGFINIYNYFTEEFIWPRGYPLRHITEEEHSLRREFTECKVGVWQFLAKGEPDVDAIYRLLFKSKSVHFQEGKSVVLGEGLVCPFNSQNTFFRKETFPLLYLPATVTFRFTDILGGYVAQPILWSLGYRLGFGPATTLHERNPHDYLIDFESEIPLYLCAEKVVEIAQKSVSRGSAIEEKMRAVYQGLYNNNIVSPQELSLLNTWLEDVSHAAEMRGL